MAILAKKRTISSTFLGDMNTFKQAATEALKRAEYFNEILF